MLVHISKRNGKEINMHHLELCITERANNYSLSHFLLNLFLCETVQKGSSRPSSGVKLEAQNVPPQIEVPALPLDELKEKTDNFGSKALIGEGSYGRVYLAVLNNGKQAAVKKLDVAAEPEPNSEFLNQVNSF
jgi:hypothetical protein